MTIWEASGDACDASRAVDAEGIRNLQGGFFLWLYTCGSRHVGERGADRKAICSVGLLRLGARSGLRMGDVAGWSNEDARFAH